MEVLPKIRDSGNSVLILTCADPRVNVFEIFGLDSVLGTFVFVVELLSLASSCHNSHF